MIARMAKVGLLAVLTMALFAGDVAAFGRRSACTPCYIPCPPVCCIGTDCVTNKCDKPVFMTIILNCASGPHTVYTGTVQPGHSVHFCFDECCCSTATVFWAQLPEMNPAQVVTFHLINRCKFPHVPCFPLDCPKCKDGKAAPVTVEDRMKAK